MARSESPKGHLAGVIGQLPRKTLVTPPPGELDDRAILEAWAACDGQYATLGERINSMIAIEVLRRGIRDGAEIVFPTGAIILRNVSAGTPEGRGYTPQEPPLALAEMVLSQRARTQPASAMFANLHLGDTGAQMAAGWTRSRAGRAYAAQFSQEGYRRAVNCANASAAVEAQGVRETVPVIIRRFSDVIHVLTALGPLTEEQRMINRALLIGPSGTES